jgi:ankyrin repeat protein
MTMQSFWTAFLILFLSACSGPAEQPSISLYLALERGDLNQVERHIRWGSDLNAPLPGGQLPLHMAAAAGRPAISRILIKHGANIESLNQAGHSALFSALSNGRTQVAQLLLKQGARLDANRMLRKLLHQQTLDRDALAWLRAQGAMLDHLDKGQSLLGDAIRLNNLELVKRLVRAGADVNLAENSGLTPIQIATDLGNKDIIRHLATRGAGVPLTPNQ